MIKISLGKEPKMKPANNLHVAIPKSIILAWAVLAVTTMFFIFCYQNQIRLDTVLNNVIKSYFKTVNNQISPPTDLQPPGHFRLLIGILTLPDHYDRRNMLRLVYGVQPRVNAHVDVKFVFCSLTSVNQRVLVGLEIMYHKDIIILNCPENMDNGKTYTYFSSLPGIFRYNKSEINGSDRYPYDYVMKVDDDSYFRLGNLVDSLRPLPRDDLYYGLSSPCTEHNPFNRYMSGMGYLLSWDILEWIRESDIPKQNLKGPEDLLVGKWLNTGGRGKHRYNANPDMYDYLGKVPTVCTHPFTPTTIGIHRLKEQDQWIKALQYFNVTDEVKACNLYHII